MFAADKRPKSEVDARERLINSENYTLQVHTIRKIENDSKETHQRREDR